MSLTGETNPSPKLRYYGESEVHNSAMELPSFNMAVHKLFCRWVRLNQHVRDFATAIEHEAQALYCDYLLAGRPTFTERSPLPTTQDAIDSCPPVPTVRVEGTPPKRFYDDEGNLNLEVDTTGIRAVLAPFFVYAMGANWFLRDFEVMARNAAASVHYNYDISCSLGGLGGCLTADQFLAAFDE